MRVPKDIEDAIRTSAKHRAIANKTNKKIRDWLSKKGLEENDSINDMLIDSIELTNDPEFFIQFLKDYKL